MRRREDSRIQTELNPANELLRRTRCAEHGSSFRSAADQIWQRRLELFRTTNSSILRNAEELLRDNDEDGEDADDDEGSCDTDGYSLYDWLNYAEVGWVETRLEVAQGSRC